MLRQQAGDVRSAFLGRSASACSRCLSKSRQVGGCLLAKRRQAAETAVLLADQLGQQLRPELRQRSLHVTAAQTTSGRCALQQCILSLLDKRLHLRAGAQLLDGLALCLRTSQPKQCLLSLQRRNTSSSERLQAFNRAGTGFDVRLEQFLNLVELTTLFSDSSFGRLGL